MFQQHLHQEAIAKNCSPWIVCCCTPGLCFNNSNIGFWYICCVVCFLTRPLGKTGWYCIFVSFVFIRDGREMYTGVHNRWKQLSVFIRVAQGTFVRWSCISVSYWFCISVLYYFCISASCLFFFFNYMQAHNGVSTELPDVCVSWVWSPLWHWLTRILGVRTTNQPTANTFNRSNHHLIIFQQLHPAAKHFGISSL